MIVPFGSLPAGQADQGASRAPLGGPVIWALAFCRRTASSSVLTLPRRGIAGHGAAGLDAALNSSAVIFLTAAVQHEHIAPALRDRLLVGERLVRSRFDGLLAGIR